MKNKLLSPFCILSALAFALPAAAYQAPDSLPSGAASLWRDRGNIESLNSRVARSNGLWGATHPANAAQKMQSNATAAAPIASGDVLNECQTSPPKNLAQALCGAANTEVLTE